MDFLTANKTLTDSENQYTQINRIVSRMVNPTLLQDAAWKLIPAIERLFAEFNINSRALTLTSEKVFHPMSKGKTENSREFHDILSQKRALCISVFSEWGEMPQYCDEEAKVHGLTVGHTMTLFKHSNNS